METSAQDPEDEREFEPAGSGDGPGVPGAGVPGAGVPGAGVPGAGGGVSGDVTPSPNRGGSKAPGRGLWPTTITPAAIRIALAQHGNLTHAQLIASGQTRRTIQHHVARGYLHRAHHGVYALGRPAQTALERSAAAVLACGVGALLGELPGLALWGYRAWPRRTVVLVPADRRRPGIVTRRTVIHRRDVRRRHNIPVASPARLLLDCAPALSDRALTRLVSEVLRTRGCRPMEVAETLHRRPAVPGAPRLRTIMGIAQLGPTRSELEDRFAELCHDHGLPLPLINHVVNGVEVDAYFPGADLVVELDSWEFHGDRQSFHRDRGRDADALERGIATLRLTWERVTGFPEREAERLARIIEARAGR